MKLLDSNIIIYSAKEEYSYLRDIYKEDNVFVSEITRLEVLGFHRILSDQENYFKSVFSVITLIPISTEIIDDAIKFRKSYNLSVGDSIISATAKLYKLKLYTNNESDFTGIKGLKIYNPLTER